MQLESNICYDSKFLASYRATLVYGYIWLFYIFLYMHHEPARIIDIKFIHP